MREKSFDGQMAGDFKRSVVKDRLGNVQVTQVSKHSCVTENGQFHVVSA